VDDEYLFDLDGGRLCLDFVNTQSLRTGEHLTTYADLLAFARQAGVITPEQHRRLRGASDEGVLGRAHALRSALFEIFSAVAAGREPPHAAMDVFNAALAGALGHARLVPREDEFAWGWASLSPEFPLWEVLRSAADLLTSPDARKVRECGAADCRWLFIDTSKNRSRQWCSMTSCGNREKARRHYERARVKQQTGASIRSQGAAS
jgi:predicted RNA-binding Zn ribbon-like protein